MACFDVDALWDLYDDNSSRRGHVVPEDRGDETGTYTHHGTRVGTTSSPPPYPCETTLVQTVTIRPDLSIPLHVPRSLLEDGCLGEVGGMVWDCSIVLARYLLLATSGSSARSAKCWRRDDDDKDNDECCDFHIDLTSYDHIVELGSGLGLLGFSLHRHLRGLSGGQAGPKITLTDFVPELVDAMRRTAADELGQLGIDGGATESLGVGLLDWSDPSDAALDTCRIQPGESVLIVASEVLYEPCHADMLAGCIDGILTKSNCGERSRVLVANFAERPGWRRFADAIMEWQEVGQEVRQGEGQGQGHIIKAGENRCRLSSTAPAMRMRSEIREMDLGSGGYELLDMLGVGE